MRIVRWAAIILVLLLAAVIAAPFLIDPNSFRPTLESELSRALGRQVKLGDLKLAILSGGVTAGDLSIADDPAYSPAPFVQAKSLKIAVDMGPLILSRKLNVTGLTIDQPQISLVESRTGEWNFSSLGGQAAAHAPAAPPAAPGKPLDLSVKLVKITDGRFSLAQAGARSRPLVLEHVNVELRDFSSASPFAFTLSSQVLGGGDLKMDGQAGPIDPQDAAMTPAGATLHVSRLDLAGSGWTQAVPGMGGLISFDGTGQSDGKAARLKGKLKVEKLKLAANAPPAARTLELDFAAEHALKPRSGRLAQGDIHIGDAIVRLTGTYAAQGESMILKMNVDGPQMPLPELAAMLPAMGIALPAGSSFQGGTAAVKLVLVGPADKLVTTGTIAMNNTTLTGFDLGTKMSRIESMVGIKQGPNTEIQTIAATIRMAPEGIAADHLQCIVPSIGELAGAGTISPARALAFKMSAKVHTGGVLAIASGTAIPFLVEGTASEPVFRPDVKAAAEGEIRNVGKKAEGFLRGLLGGKK